MGHIQAGTRPQHTSQVIAKKIRKSVLAVPKANAGNIKYEFYK